MATKTTTKRTRDPQTGKGGTVADGKASKTATTPAAKPATRKEKVVVLTASQIAEHVGTDPKNFRKWYRETVENDGAYTRYGFPVNAPATKKLLQMAMAHFNPKK
jgi:hypothetical protein